MSKKEKMVTRRIDSDFKFRVINITDNSTVGEIVTQEKRISKKKIKENFPEHKIKDLRAYYVECKSRKFELSENDFIKYGREISNETN